MAFSGKLERIRAAMPGLDTAMGYKREWLVADLRAGVVLTMLLIPAGIGYAQAAGLPAYTGLYATTVPLLVYAVFGPSRILVLGPDSSLAPIIAAAILPLALGDDARAVALAGLLAIMVGVVLILGGLARIGFVTDLLSKPIRIGYLNGVALVVIISQVPKLLGFSVERAGPLENIGRIFAGIGDGRIAVLAAIFGVGSIAVILVFRIAFRQRGIGTFVAVAAATALIAVLGLEDSIPTVGAMPRGFPAPALVGLGWSDVLSLVGPALGIALITFADTGVLSRTLAARRGESVSGSQEMIGLGAANVAGGLLGGFPVSSSASRTPVAEQAGAQTQLTNVVGAVLIVLFMSAAPDVTRYLPEAVLAGVVIVAASTFIDVKSLVRLWGMDRTDALLSLAAFLGVYLVGVLEGIVVTIALSFLAFALQAWRPYRAELGLVPGLRGYHDRSRHPGAERVPGVVIVRFDAPLFFANGGIFDTWARSVVRKADKEERGAGRPGVHTVILAAEPITDIDTTAIDELVELDEFLAARDIALVLAEVKGPVKDHLTRWGMTERFPPERFKPTVGAAVDEITGVLRRDIDGTEED
ncbi:MAG TPA: SulP family inorganic anion transporter [Actinomycetaceae bacterium]|nr:SulP family inorganic anion transporter [Actinomycetaceae bacterium]